MAETSVQEQTMQENMLGMETEEEMVRRKREEFNQQRKDEEVLFSGSVVLYRYKKDPKGWVVRGRGKISVARNLESSKHRIYHIREKVFKLGCNHYINPSLNLKKYELEENCWMWLTFGDHCGDSLEEVQTFLAKFTNSDDAAAFKEAVEKGKAADKPAEPKEKAADQLADKPAESEEKAADQAPDTTTVTAKPAEKEPVSQPANDHSATDQSAPSPSDTPK